MRHINSSLIIPTHILALYIKVSPPIISFSSILGRVARRSRILVANFSLYAIVKIIAGIKKYQVVHSQAKEFARQIEKNKSGQDRANPVKSYLAKLFSVTAGAVLNLKKEKNRPVCHVLSWVRPVN